MIIENLGGVEKARAVIEASNAGHIERWNQDSALIGRILRAHLYVEHYLGEYLQYMNPRLGNLGLARLKFSQKVALVDPNDRNVGEFVTGIRHLNKVRNRLAHTLKAELTKADAHVFLSCPSFNALRSELAKPSKPGADPIEVLEEFSQYAAYSLSNPMSPLSQAIGKALQSPPNNSLQARRP